MWRNKYKVQAILYGMKGTSLQFFFFCDTLFGLCDGEKYSWVIDAESGLSPDRTNKENRLRPFFLHILGKPLLYTSGRIGYP